MALQFTEENHKYTSIDPTDNTVWMSATTFVGMFKKPFDKEGIAAKVSKKRGSKWFGLEPERIIQIWEEEATRATDLGTWYHGQREEELLQCEVIRRDGRDIPIICPRKDGDVKIASDQRLVEGIYPEHLIYLRSAELCGQADRVEVIGNRIDLYDYKTNKEIKVKGFTSWDGAVTKMLGPCSHLDDCNFNHYALQLSVYMYMMLKHNHFLDAGKMEIHHIVFEIECEDEYGNPVTKRDHEGNPIVKEVIPYPVPYLKAEVINMIKYVKSLKTAE